MSTNSSSLLRKALIGNSIFCTTSGLIFTMFSNSISAFLGIQASVVILILGIVLFLYGVEVFIFARKESINEPFARFVIGADIAWVIGSVVLIFTNLIVFATPGKWGIAIIADIVLVFAIVQFVGLRRMANP